MAKSFWSDLEDAALDEMQRRIDAAKAKYKPAKNLRYVEPCVCAYCKHFMMAAGFAMCERPDGFSADTGDMWHYEMTCDYFKRREE